MNKKNILALIFFAGILITIGLTNAKPASNVSIMFLDDPYIYLGNNSYGNNSIDDDGVVWATLYTDQLVSYCEINWEGSWQTIDKKVNSTSHVYSSEGTKIVYYRCYDDNENSVSVNDEITINLLIDSDSDGIFDDVDNCPLVANPDQVDTDNDGIGDVCETCANQAPISHTSGPYNIVSGEGKQFDGSSSSDTACGDHIAQYLWDFNNDGNTDATGATTSLSWAQMQATVCGGSCATGNSYTIRLTVIDSLGASGSSTTTINILACNNGDTRSCENQNGVCSGSVKTCTNNQWPGPCSYSLIPYYETTELSCDGRDNNCNGNIDEGFNIGSTCLSDFNSCGNSNSGSYVCAINGIESVCNAQVPVAADTDSDGVANCIDNCVNISNPDQTDSDNNGIGNACQPECYSNTDCSDNLFCNGIETCNAGSCVNGTNINCNANNLLGINTCTSIPDNNPLTLDFRNLFTSVCNEASDSCTTGNTTIISSCDKTRCGAQCDANNSCPVTNCSNKDGCVGTNYYDYQDVVNNCTSGCSCTNNSCSSHIITANDARCVVKCYTNSGCNDNNEYTKDTCNNPGTLSSSCSHETIACLTNSNCNDNNAKTEDKCINAGTVTSYCSYETIACSSNAECGIDGYATENYCESASHNLFRDYKTYTCNNPGTSVAACKENITKKLIEDCIDGCENNVCVAETAPTITSTPVTEATEGVNYNYQVTATDKEQNSLWFASTGYNINPLTGMISFTPTKADVGTHQITVTVSDSWLTDEQTYTLIINGINNAPVLSTIEDLTAKEDELFEIKLTATDKEQDTLTYSDNSPLFDIENDGTIKFTPAKADVGTHQITVTVSDGKLADSKTFTLSILAKEIVNTAPTITSFDPLNDITITELQQQTFSITAEDAESKPGITWYLNDISTGTGNSYTFVGDNSKEKFNAGIYNIKAVTSDGKFTAEKSWVLTVLRVKDTDEDSIPDETDNCVFVFNTEQIDSDGNGIGDACQDNVDGDSVLDEEDFVEGNVNNIDSNMELNLNIGGEENLNRVITGVQPIVFQETTSEEPIVEFDYDFTSETKLDLSKIEITKQPETASSGEVIVRGIDLTSQGQTKNIYLDKISGTNTVCIKDAEIASIKEISDGCTGTNEHLIACDGKDYDGYKCTIEGKKYKVDGLKHSGVKESYVPECTIDADCNDNLFCNGIEKCNAGSCVNGTIVSCSANNLLLISGCNAEDNNPFTFDFRNIFTSKCNEEKDSCNIPTFAEKKITHTCDKTQCGAQCEKSSDCNDNNEYTTDICAGCKCKNNPIKNFAKNCTDNGMRWHYTVFDLESIKAGQPKTISAKLASNLGMCSNTIYQCYYKGQLYDANTKFTVDGNTFTCGKGSRLTADGEKADFTHTSWLTWWRKDKQTYDGTIYDGDAEVYRCAMARGDCNVDDNGTDCVNKGVTETYKYFDDSESGQNKCCGDDAGEVCN